METATRIGFGEYDGQRRRIVTLDGTVTNVDGSQYGGGNPIRGAIGKNIQ